MGAILATTDPALILSQRTMDQRMMLISCSGPDLIAHRVFSFPFSLLADLYTISDGFFVLLCHIALLSFFAES
jgi:hypothetical protein